MEDGKEKDCGNNSSQPSTSGDRIPYISNRLCKLCRHWKMGTGKTGKRIGDLESTIIGKGVYNKMNRGFRVFDKQENRMIENPTTGDEGIFIAENGNLVKPDNTMLYLMDRYARMDSTGLLDKYGKEGYHKDIVKDLLTNSLFVIEWNEGKGRFQLMPIELPKTFHYIREIECLVDMEIIGNKYGNPELSES